MRKNKKFVLIKKSLASTYLEKFAIQARFLATILDDAKYRFDQEILRNGMDALEETLSEIRRIDPAYASTEGFVRLQKATNYIMSTLEIRSITILKRAANLANYLSRMYDDKKIKGD